jgi:hypothetical protein
MNRAFRSAPTFGAELKCAPFRPTAADELATAVAWAGSADGPVFIRVHIGVAQLKTNYILEDPAVLAEDFRRWLRAAQQSPSCLG